MDIGIFTRTFAGAKPQTVLQSVRQAGFRVAHWNMACSGLPSLPEFIPPQAAAAVAAAAEKTGVALVGVSATYNMVHPDPAVRQRGRRSLAAIAAAAPAMATRLVTLCTGSRDPEDQWRAHPDNATPEAWRDLLSEIEAALALAEAQDVELGVEPERANVVVSAAAARRLIAEMQSPRLKIVLDPANLVEAEPADEQRRIVAEAVDLLADRLVMAHAKDHTADGRFVAAGKGVLDFSHYLRCLGGIGFSGPLVAHGLAPEEAPEVAEFLSHALVREKASRSS